MNETWTPLRPTSPGTASGAGPGDGRSGSAPWRTRLAAPSRRARWRRVRLLRVLCAALAGTGVWQVTDALRPRADLAGETVVVAARDVSVGATLSAADLALERRAAAHRPATALERLDLAVGRVAASPIATGEILTPGRVQGVGQLAGLPPGRLAVSVPLIDPGILSALQPGDRVDVFATSTGRQVADAAPVLTLSRPQAEGPAGAGAGTGGTARVVLALTAAQAEAVAASLSAQAGGSGFVLAVRGH